MIAALLAGTVAGIVHVFVGPDHLAAMTPLAVTARSRAWRVGVRWGLGHTAGVAVIAGLAFFLREALPLERLSAWSERIVGVVLIAIGLWSIRVGLRSRVHLHEHEHGDLRHSHIHVHEKGSTHDAEHAHAHPHAAFGVGALHGLAGSSHILGVLPALAFSASIDAVTYLGGYGIGSIAAMAVYALGVGGASERLGDKADKAYRRLVSAAGLAAIVVGVFWLVG
jgi:cytochrome c biogenesis protein CcdA